MVNLWRFFMRAPSLRSRRIAILSAAPIAVLLAGSMVWQGSNAAFSTDTRSTGNSWETGSVFLSDDDGGAAMFQIQNVTPGQTGTKCIRVTATSSVAGLVRTYVGDLAADGLQQYIKVTIQQGTVGAFAGCGLFVADATEASQSLSSLFTDHATYGTGVLPWTTVGEPLGESKTYKFTWVFDTTGLDQPAIDALQGKAVSINFEWELQNT
jgi:hypothetical protein